MVIAEAMPPPCFQVKATGGASAGGPTRVLFVCLGNICRSPSAEAVMQHVVEKRGLAAQYVIDSCGTGGGSDDWYMDGGFSYHVGDPADPRMRAAAEERGITLRSRSRPLKVRNVSMGGRPSHRGWSSGAQGRHRCGPLPLQPSDLGEFDHILAMDPSNIAAIHEAADHWRAQGKLGVPRREELSLKVRLITDYSTKHRGKPIPDPYYGGRRGFEEVLDLLTDTCDELVQALS